MAEQPRTRRISSPLENIIQDQQQSYYKDQCIGKHCAGSLTCDPRGNVSTETERQVGYCAEQQTDRHMNPGIEPVG